jgi:hypothetical protein
LYVACLYWFVCSLLCGLSNIEVKGADIIGNVEKKDKITNAPATKETVSSEKIQIVGANSG